MKHKLLRGLLALVLVCVLVVNVSPIRARAMMPVVGWDSFAFDIAQIVTSAAYNLGLREGESPSAFNQFVSDAIDAWKDFSGKTKDTMDLFMYRDVDGVKFYVPQNFVSWLFNFMWNSGILKDGNTSISGSAAVPEWAIAEAKAARYAVLCYYTFNGSGPSPLLAYSNESPVFAKSTNSNGTGLSVRCEDLKAVLYLYNSSYDSFVKNTGSCFSGNKYYVITTTHIFGTEVETNVSTDDDFTLGYIAPSDKFLGDGYPQWVQNSAYIEPNEVLGVTEGTTVLPLALGQTLEETKSFTQEQGWLGQGTLQAEIEGALEGTVAGTTWGIFTQWLGRKLDFIPRQILKGITAIFVPQEDFLTAKWEAIRSEFAFADSIMTSGDMILGVLNGLDPEPPVIYIDLGASEGSYDIGGEVPFLDLRWYERYKPTGDAIISAFLWLVFVWRMFIKLPGIIGGLPGDFVMQGVVNLGLSEHLPARKKEYEYERQQNRRSMKK